MSTKFITEAYKEPTEGTPMTLEPKMYTIYQAMALILADIDSISKNRKADMGKAGSYAFRGIDDIYNSLHGSFAKYKVFIIPEIIEKQFEVQEKIKEWNGSQTKSLQYSCVLTVKFTFVSEDGSSISATGIGHALDSSDKATNKAQSSALKYCLMQTFLIPTQEVKDVETQNLPVERPKPKFMTDNQVTLIVSTMLENGLDAGRSIIADFQGQGVNLTPEQAKSLGEISKQIQETEAKEVKEKETINLTPTSNE